jgi:hypothetical protein
MKRHFLSRLLAGLAALAIVAGMQPLAPNSVPAQAATPRQPASCQTFTASGQAVCGRFLAYWNTHGGLAQQGYPISGEVKEVSDIDGKTYTVQYFERAVFEYHPENKPPYDVLLSLLGSMFYKQRFPNGAPELVPPPGPSSPLFFPQTGKQIVGLFRDYWEKHGGLMQQGYPISNEFMETSQVDGKQYRVQYFERTVMEYHPEKQPPYNVLLSQLGTLQLKKKYGTGQGSLSAVQTGTWGGEHVVMNVTNTGATFEFDCAHGSTNGVLTADSSGRVDIAGIYVFEHGGPSRGGEEDSHPARYTGTTDGKTMTVTVTLRDTGQTIGTFKIVYGQQGHVVNCV